MSRIAVAGPSTIVTNAAATAADEGGSVADVAAVAALTAMCTEPGVCGPGGGGFITVDVPGSDPVVIDGYMAHPGIGFELEPMVAEVSMPYGGGVTTVVGPGTVAVPGAFAALEVASDRFGSLPWRTLMEVVADAIEGGFPLSPACHLYMREGATEIFAADPATREALFDESGLKPVGANIVLSGLADTLRHIGRAGAGDFYRGELARHMIDDLAERGSGMTLEDLASYRAIAREPIRSSVQDWSLALNPGPAVGGWTVSTALESLKGDTAVDRAKALVEAFETRQRSGPPSTISVAAASDDGGVVAASFSAGYGSGVVPEGTGMLMNNAVGELELVVGDPVPGERMVSNMAPTVARRGEDAVAIGSPGADRITSAVVTTLARLAMGDSLGVAIDHPRCHPVFDEDGVRLAAEPGQDLDAAGWTIDWYEGPHMYFGGVNGAGLIDGALDAHADARRTGSVAFTS